MDICVRRLITDGEFVYRRQPAKILSARALSFRIHLIWLKVAVLRHQPTRVIVITTERAPM